MTNAYESGRDMAVRVTACRGLDRAVREHSRANDGRPYTIPCTAWDVEFARGENDALLNMVFVMRPAQVTA
jgi:hypothetical protein